MMTMRTNSPLLSRCLRFRCSYHTSSSAGDEKLAPLLVKIRSDLKSAMRNRDKDRCVKCSKRCLEFGSGVIETLTLILHRNRLNVIRTILGDATNFSHAALHHKPPETDSQVLVLLKTRLKLSKAAAADFRAAKRDDLSDLEESQIAVLQEYVGLVPVASDEEIKKLVAEIIDKQLREQTRLNSNTVTRDLLRTLDGKQVEMALVTRTIRDMLFDLQIRLNEPESQQS